MDIHQQLQENSLAGIKLPRDISSDIDASTQVEEPGGTWRLHLDTSNRSGSSSPRSKSPLEFLNALPGLTKSALPSFSKTMNPPNFPLPKPNLITNLQQLKLIKKIKSTVDAGRVKGPDTDQSESDSEGVSIMSDKKSGLILKEEDNKEVVLDSCGILATSPNQVLLSSMHLKAENKHKSSLAEFSPSPKTGRHHASQAKSTVTEESAFTFDSSRVNDEGIDVKNISKLAAEKDISGVHHVMQSDNSQTENHQEDLNDMVLGEDTDIIMPEEVPKADFEIISQDDEDSDYEEYCVMENEEVRAILDKCHQLHHPLMKTSLSDTSLSLTASHETNIQTSVDQKDSGFVSLFKSKMPGFTKPSLKRVSEQPLSKSHIRKSQRAIEVFEQLMKEKLPDKECKTHFIFI